MNKTRSYKEDLLKALQDPTEASEDLDTALEDENLHFKSIVPPKLGG